MSNAYIKHAEREFHAAGWTDENGNFKDEMQRMICDHVLRLLNEFADEGHSGSTAPYTISLFKNLASFEPICPLTGEDFEWNLISDKEDLWQNNRCGHVFKQNGKAYDIDGKIFWEYANDGTKVYFTSFESRVPVEFPYVPKREYVQREGDNN